MGLDTTQLEAIATRAEKATDGPWELSDVHGDQELIVRHSDGSMQSLQAYRYVLAPNLYPHWRNDCDPIFIAAARTDIPALLAEIRGLREEQNRYCATLEQESVEERET